MTSGTTYLSADGSEKATSLSENLRQLLCKVPPSHSTDGVMQSVNFADVHCVRHVRCASRNVQDSLGCHVHGGHVERLNPGLRHALSVSLRVRVLLLVRCTHPRARTPRREQELRWTTLLVPAPPTRPSLCCNVSAARGDAATSLPTVLIGHVMVSRGHGQRLDCDAKAHPAFDAYILATIPLVHGWPQWQTDPTMTLRSTIWSSTVWSEGGRLVSLDRRPWQFVHKTTTTRPWSTSGLDGKVRGQHGVLFRRNPEFVVECVMPDVLHVVPIRDDTMLGGQSRQTQQNRDAQFLYPALACGTAATGERGRPP